MKEEEEKNGKERIAGNIPDLHDHSHLSFRVGGPHAARQRGLRGKVLQQRLLC